MVLVVVDDKFNYRTKLIIIIIFDVLNGWFPYLT